MCEQKYQDDEHDRWAAAATNGWHDVFGTMVPRYELDWRFRRDVVLSCFGLMTMSEENDSQVSEQEEGFICLTIDTSSLWKAMVIEPGRIFW